MSASTYVAWALISNDKQRHLPRARWATAAAATDTRTARATRPDWWWTAPARCCSGPAPSRRRWTSAPSDCWLRHCRPPCCLPCAACWADAGECPSSSSGWPCPEHTTTHSNLAIAQQISAIHEKILSHKVNRPRCALLLPVYIAFIQNYRRTMSKQLPLTELQCNNWQMRKCLNSTPTPAITVCL